jgi:hypothetical protein
MALYTNACQSGHKALWCDLADTMVVHVTYVDVATPIHNYSTRQAKPSNGPFSVSMAYFASTCQSGHMSLWCDHTNTIIGKVCHDDVADLIH